MPLGTLSFAGWNWLWFAAGAVAVAFLLLMWGYRGGPAIRWICIPWKVLGFAALAFCLLEPLWSGQRVRPGANLFAIVADNSQGLQIKDRNETKSRGEILRDMVNSQHANWQDSLEQNFDLRRYVFDARLQATKDFSELAFDGRATSLGAALKTLGERYRGRPLAGILLFTDGNATDLRDAPDL